MELCFPEDCHAMFFIRFVVYKKITSSFPAKKLFFSITLTFIGLFN